MKTVSGKIVSTKPVNLSKAANILSNFVTSDNGASQSVSAYLRRASAAFNELVFFKKHHKLEKDHSKEGASTKSGISLRIVEEDRVRVPENGELNMNFDQDVVENNENGTRKVEGKLRKKDKKKKKDGSLGSGKNDNTEVDFEQDNENMKKTGEEKKKKKKDGSLGSGKNENTKVDFEQDNENVKEKSEEKKKKKKKDGSLGSGKHDNTEVDLNENVKEKSEEKKKKKKDGSLGSGKNDNTEIDLNENVKEKSEEKKKKKKRKNAEVDGSETFNSMSPESKKRRRTEADDE